MWTYAWTGGHVTSWTDEQSSFSALYTMSWVGDLMVGFMSSHDGKAPGGWNAVLDGSGRVAALRVTDGEIVTWEYEGDSAWPSSITSSESGPELPPSIVCDDP